MQKNVKKLCEKSEKYQEKLMRVKRKQHQIH